MNSNLLLLCREVACGHEPGFRDVYVRCRAFDGHSTFNLELMVSKRDALAIAECVIVANLQAWYGGQQPLDAESLEVEPDWPSLLHRRAQS